MKQQIKDLKQSSHLLTNDSMDLRNQFLNLTTKNTFLPISSTQQNQPEDSYINLLHHVNFQKWHVNIRIIINEEYDFTTVALIDSGADLNCMFEGLVPDKYF